MQNYTHSYCGCCYECLAWDTYRRAYASILSYPVANDFNKDVAKTIRKVREHFDSNPGEIDKSVREQVSADLDKLANKRENNERF